MIKFWQPFKELYKTLQIQSSDSFNKIELITTVVLCLVS